MPRKRKLRNKPGITWNKQRPIERRLARALQALAKQVVRITLRYNSVSEITAAITDITHNPIWEAYALKQALSMTKMVAVQNAATWREAAMEGQNGYKIYESLRAEMAGTPKFDKLIAENAAHITSLPDDISKHVTKFVSTQAIRGERAESMVEHIRERAPELSEARINLIARTETAKTQATITKIRSQEIGLDWYIWRTAEDLRVRSSHKHMHGVACQYSSPPSPETLKGEPNVGYYGPGEIWNCRCYAEPVIDPDYLSDSLRVVYQGSIVRLSRAKFEKLLS